MLFIITVILILYFLCNPKTARKNIFTLTIIETIFFFSARDPFIEITLWFYCMLISIILTMSQRIFVKKKLFMEFILLFVVFIIPLIYIGLGLNKDYVLLIGKSTADVWDTVSEMKNPTLDFTVWKHLIYMVIYLYFVMINEDIYKDNKYRKFLVKTIETGFCVLLPCIIVEFIVVNALGGFNDRKIMSFIFSIEQVNQDYLYGGFIPGLKCVALCFSERSNIFILIFLYIILFNKKMLHIKELLLLAMSYGAVLATGSSTAVGIAGVFSMMILIKGLVVKNYLNTYIIILYGLIFAIGILFCIKYKDSLFMKINEYFSDDEGWGSAYFRRNANAYGMEAFLKYPLFGVGIGTVMAHSLLIQTLANIGLAGFLGVYHFHKQALQIKNNMNYCLILCAVLVICYAAFMVQHFSSPMLVAIIICASTRLNSNKQGKEVQNEN